MDRFVRWAVGLVALLGAISIAYAGAVAGDMLPNGAAPLYVLASVFAVVAVICFWPRPSETHSRDIAEGQVPSPTKILESRDEIGISPGRMRAFAIFMLGSGAFIAVLSLFGLTLRRFGNAPPAVVGAGGVFVMVIGATALAFSFTERSAKVGYLSTRILLYSIIVLFTLVPVIAIIAVLLGH